MNKSSIQELVFVGLRHYWYYIEQVSGNGIVDFINNEEYIFCLDIFCFQRSQVGCDLMCGNNLNLICISEVTGERRDCVFVLVDRLGFEELGWNNNHSPFFKLLINHFGQELPNESFPIARSTLKK